MRKIVFILAITLLGLNVMNAQDYQWPLDSDAKDAIGTKHGQLVGNATFITDDERGDVLSLDGNGSYVKLPEELLSDVTDLTITCWFNYAGAHVWERVYSFGYSDATDTEGPSIVQTIYLVPKDGDGKLHVTYQATGDWTDWATATNLIEINTWYFSAFVRKADSLYFLINGERVPGYEAAGVAEDPSLLNDSANYIGKSHWPDATFKGMVDDLRIYKGVLTDAEIAEMYVPPTVQGVAYNQQFAPQVYSQNGFIIIKNTNNDEINSIEIYNLVGKVVYKTINIQEVIGVNLPSSIYIVKVSSNNSTYIQKVNTFN